MMAGMLTAFLIFAVAYWFVRRGEDIRSRHRSPSHDIDRDVLEQAEREVRDLGIDHHPDDGFEGDDWGPGAK
jgi:hypothetical protein